jgi:hypothetical protein
MKCAAASQLFAVLASLATGAHAADPPSYSYDCDTAAGRYAHWTRTVSGSEITIAGKLRVLELLKHEKWNPVASILLRGTGERPPPFGIRLFVSKASSDQFSLELMKVGGRDAIGTGEIPRTKKPIPFTLHLDSSGTLKVSIAGIESSTTLGTFKPATFELSCSTGDFEFTDTTVVEK